MAILSPTNLETANYGTVGWNAIYSSNFQKINDFFKRFDMSRYAITYSSSITYNCSNGNLQSVTLTGNTTISFSNGFAGGKFYLIIKQDSTGGRTVSWGSNVRFLTGVSNQVDLNANAVTILGFVYNDIDTKYDCFLNSYALGALTTNITTVSANTTLDGTYHVVLVNASGGNRTITLVDATKYRGIEYIIKKIDSSSNTVTIATQSSQTIDGQTSEVLDTQYQVVKVVSDGSNWYKI